MLLLCEQVFGIIVQVQNGAKKNAVTFMKYPGVFHSWITFFINIELKEIFTPVGDIKVVLCALLPVNNWYV